MAEDRNVIWVGSYPKSGNTWVHDVLRTAGKRWGFPPGPMDVYDILRNGRLPEICEPVIPEFARYPCSVLKTHSILTEGKPQHEFDGLQLHTVGFIYVYRNPLDLLLSYINFTRLEYASMPDNRTYAGALFHDTLGMPVQPAAEEWAKVTLDDIPRSVLDHALGVYSERGLTLPTCFPQTPWSSHVRSWVMAAEAIPAVVMKYEDCVADPETFYQMCKFFLFGPADIQKALASSASRSRKAATEGTPEQKIFFNKMEAYYYPRYFSAAAIENFRTKYAEVLGEFGYDSILRESGSRES